jgi:hypothetical protein
MSLIADLAWWIPLIIAVAGVGVLLAGNSRMSGGMRNAGAIVVLFGLLLLVLGFLLDSPRKAVERSTRQFVEAVSSGNWNDVQGMLAPGVRWDWPGQPWHADGPAEVLAGAKMVVKNSGLHAASAKQPRVADSGDSYTNTCVVWISSDATGGASVDSDWQFTWRQTADKWQLTHLSVTRVDDSAPSGIRSTLDKH